MDDPDLKWHTPRELAWVHRGQVFRDATLAVEYDPGGWALPCPVAVMVGADDQIVRSDFANDGDPYAAFRADILRMACGKSTVRLWQVMEALAAHRAAYDKFMRGEIDDGNSDW